MRTERLYFNENTKGNISCAEEFLDVTNIDDLPFKRIGIKTRGQIIEFNVSQENYNIALFLYYCLIREGKNFLGGAFYFTELMKLEAYYYFGSEICFDVFENRSSTQSDILKLLFAHRNDGDPISVILSRIDHSKLVQK